MTDPVLREAFELWPAWQCLVGYVSRTDPTEADPQSIYGSLCAVKKDRLIALLYAHQPVDTIEDAGRLLVDIMTMAAHGQRPRYGREMGLTFP